MRQTNRQLRPHEIARLDDPLGRRLAAEEDELPQRQREWLLGRVLLCAGQTALIERGQTDESVAIEEL